jgi:membrane protein YqaA with SNARE-associated domain
MESIGYLALFTASFLSATVVPFSSEAALAATLLSGGDPLLCLVIATIGNTLGGMTGYLLGRWGRQAFEEKRSDLSNERRQKWLDRIERHGGVAALGCWLPGIGDFIAAAMGALRVEWLPTLFWMTIGKAARYALVLGIIPSSA